MSQKAPATDGGSTSTLSFMARAKRTTESVIATGRPWREVLDISAVSLPFSYDEAMSRVRHNLSYFRVNYALIVLIIVFLGLIYHPISMVVFILVFIAWVFLYFSRDANDPVLIAGRPVDDRVVLGFLSLITILALAYIDVGENVLVSLIIGVVLVGAHAALRGTEDLFLDEESARGGGLVSVVGNRPVQSSASYSPI